MHAPAVITATVRMAPSRRCSLATGIANLRRRDLEQPLSEAARPRPCLPAALELGATSSRLGRILIEANR